MTEVMDPRYLQQITKGDCMHNGIVNNTTSGTSTMQQMAFYGANSRNFLSWERQQRIPYMQTNMPNNMFKNVAHTSDVYMAPNRKMCQYVTQNETLDLTALGTQRAQFIPSQFEASLSEAEMFLVENEEIFRHENQSRDSPYIEETGAVYEKDEEQGMETKIDIEKGRKDLTVKQEDDESEEARALRIKEKNRIAAKICRRRKKEYIRCLEQRVASLEKQNEALLLKLKFFKDIYDREHSFGY